VLVADPGGTLTPTGGADEAREVASGDPIRALAGFIRTHGPLFVLTGAGVSTDSGIPDYRDRDGRWKVAEPIRYQAFVRDPAARRRYWSRSLLGWPRVAAAEPNGIHCALADLERLGLVHQLVTQNVDGLHQRAGARRVIDLHGRLDGVHCLDCGGRLTRARMQSLLTAINPDHPSDDAATTAPDGDALPIAGTRTGAADTFKVPPCPGCGGVLKPSVVFFGENVPRPRVERAMARLAESRGVLVLGSSLRVFSGYRFCLEAERLDLPIALVNLGHTRADHLAGLKLDAACAAVLTPRLFSLIE
jgi:NAD-dependent SIR2 family protein deacetylase